LLTLAKNVRRPLFFLWAHYLLGEVLLYSGELVLAREHLEHGLAFYDPQRRRSYRGPHDPSVACSANAALALWCSGYPDQARKQAYEATALARELTLPFSLAHAMYFTAVVHQARREGRAAQEQAEAVISLCSEQGITLYLEHGT